MKEVDNKRIPEIAISSILIFLISDKICLILTQFTLIILPKIGSESTFLFIVISILIVVFSMWVFIKMYEYFNLRSKARLRDIWLLIGLYLFLILIFALFNFLVAKLQDVYAGYSSTSHYLELFALSKGIPRMLFLGVVVYFMFILKNKTIAFKK